MQATRFDLVLFDLDGTLVDTVPELADAVNDCLRHFGLPASPEEAIARLVGHGTEILVLRALAAARNLDPEVLRGQAQMAEARGVFDRCYAQRCGTRSQLYPHVLRTLQGLQARGTRLGMVTNKEARFTHALLQAHGLVPLLDPVVCGDDVAVRKPDPAGIHLCLQRTGVPAARALFVGDSAIDVATARRAGVAVWAVPYGYNQGRPVAESGPDRLIEDLSPLLD